MIEFKPSDFEVGQVDDTGGYKVTIKISDTFAQLVTPNGMLPSKAGIESAVATKTNSKASINLINKTIVLDYEKNVTNLAMTDFSQACADAANSCVRSLIRSMESYATVIDTTIKPNKPK